MTAPVCPCCAAPSRRRFSKHGHWIRDCTACGHRFAELAPSADHVQRVYGDAYFTSGGAGYADYLGEGELLRERGRWYAGLLARHMAPGTVLDVGAAAGFWLAGLADRGWRGRGIEPNATMAAYARDRLGLDVRTGTLESADLRETFDLVGLIQVVAHFVDVRAALAAAADRVRPGGFLLVETWNRKSLTARLLGRSWHEYSPPSVLHWFDPQGLARSLAPLGLRPVARGRPRRRIGAGHAKSLIRYKYAGSAAGRAAGLALALLPDRVSLPYPADDLFWMLLRKGDVYQRGVSGTAS